MADYALMYEEDHFVVLAPGAEEEILTVAELLERLTQILSDRQDTLPRELAKIPTAEEQAQYLLHHACDLELAPGQTLQWYAIRLEK